jgi:oligosaccharide repeat unit polymerase
MMVADRLGRLKYRQVLVAGSVLLVIFGVMRGLRDESMQDASYLSRVVGEGKMFEDLVVNRNFACVTKTAKIYDKTPERMPREYGQTLLLWTVAWIPRTLWAGKPEISVGDRVQHEIYQDPVGGGYPPGIVGELIINFGLFGTLVGALAFGAFLRYFYNSFLPAVRGNPTLLLLYVSTVVEVSFVMMGLQVARVIMDLLKILVTTGVFLFLASTRRATAARAWDATPAGAEVAR